MNYVYEVDKMVLGVGSLRVNEQEVSVRFQNPKMRGLIPFVSELAITINRFTLSSTMILATLVEGQGMVGQWLRRGSCLLPKF